MDINVRFGKAPRRRRRKRAGVAAAVVAIAAAIAVFAGKMIKGQQRAQQPPAPLGTPGPR
ncbi:MAG: hypothetical protein AAB074_18900 [Planctomycetota bacterium]